MLPERVRKDILLSPLAAIKPIVLSCSEAALVCIQHPGFFPKRWPLPEYNVRVPRIHHVLSFTAVVPFLFHTSFYCWWFFSTKDDWDDDDMDDDFCNQLRAELEKTKPPATGQAKPQQS